MADESQLVKYRGSDSVPVTLTAINDPRLSFGALGLLAFLQTHDCRSVTEILEQRNQELQDGCRKNGRASTNSYLGELTRAGYVKLERSRRVITESYDYELQVSPAGRLK